MDGSVGGVQCAVQCEVFSVQYSVLCSECGAVLVFGVWYCVMFFSVRCEVLIVWCSVSCSVCGVQCVVQCDVYSVWCIVRCAVCGAA